MSNTNPYTYSELKTLEKENFLPIGNSDYSINQNAIWGNVRGDKGVKKLSLDFLTIEEKYIGEDDSLELLLSYKFESHIKSIRVPFEAILPQKIGMLAAKGVPVNHETAKALSNALQLIASELTAKKIVSQLGFNYLNNKLQFVGVEDGDVLSTAIKDKFLIGTKGTLEEELSMVKRLIQPHVPLQLAYILGLTAITIKMDQEKLGLDLYTPIYYLLNDSSSGKTTALMAAVSPFGCPNPRMTKSFIQPFLTTDNATISLATKMNGFVLGLDDLGSTTSIKKTSLIYTLANGQSKSRGTSEGNVIIGDSFSCCAIGTGEISILDKLTSSGGAQLRCIEWSNLTFTKSSEHSDELKCAVSENYGHIATSFATELLQIDNDALKSFYQNGFPTELEPKNLSNKLNRYLKVLKCIPQTALLVNEIFDFNFDVDGINELVAENLNAAREKLDYSLVAYEKFCNWVEVNQDSFSIDEKAAKNSNKTFGQIKSENSNLFVYLTREMLKEITNQLELPDMQSFLKELKVRKLLLTDNDQKHLSKKVGTRRFYIIKVNIDLH
ncbi:DUF927 domain-containing protein [Vagococcus sp. JNUCC 83]